MKPEVHWKLRKVLADNGMYKTTDLHKALQHVGVHLSKEQVYRLTTSTPQRLNMDVFAGICAVLNCNPNDIIEVHVDNADQSAPATGTSGALPSNISPIRANVSRPDGIDTPH